MPDDKVKKVIETIKNVATTSQGGDRRKYIYTLDDVIHIHSGDKHMGDSSKGLQDEEL